MRLYRSAIAARTGAPAAGAAFISLRTSTTNLFIKRIQVSMASAVASFIGLARISNKGTVNAPATIMSPTMLDGTSNNFGSVIPAVGTTSFRDSLATVDTGWSVQPTQMLDANANPMWIRRKPTAGTIGETFEWVFDNGLLVAPGGGSLASAVYGITLFNYGPATGGLLDVAFEFERKGK